MTACDVRRMIMPNDPIMVEAVEAMRRYHQALKADEPAAQIARLRLLSEQQFQFISDYLLAALPYQALRRH